MWCVTDVKQCIPLSEEMTFEEGSSHFVNPLTAIGMVERLKQLKAKTVIITAAASQLARMCIKLCHMEGITPICTVRREEQVQFLQETFGVKYVVNTGEEGWKMKLGMICLKLKPLACLECISGDMTGTMLDFMGFGSTLILYGTLSEKPAGNINTIAFIGKNCKLEGYLLSVELAKMSLFQYMELVMKAEPLMKSDLSTVVQKTFGLHQIKEAIDFYQKNQTAGKVLLQPHLTQPAAKL